MPLSGNILDHSPLKMVDYCDILFNWECDKDPTYVTDYFMDKGVKGDGHDSLSFPNKLLVSKCNEDENSVSHCQLTVQCKSFYHVGITGVRVISESRNMEVYSVMEGYLQTVRGRSVSNSEDTQYFVSDFESQEPTLSLSFKFLSLKDRSSFELKRVQISLTQMEPPSDPSAMDLQKLRSQVEELGDKVSENAKSLLETMEQYQKNQMGTMDSVRSMLSDSSLPPGKESSLSGMAGLLSVFSQMNHRTSKNSNSTAVTRTDPTGELADRVLSQMTSGQNGESMHSEDMYNFLQSVCEKVSKLRNPPKEKASYETSEIPDKDTLSSNVPEEKSVSSDVLAVIAKEIQASEDRIVLRMQKQISEAEARLNQKMDTILRLLSPANDIPAELNFSDETPSPQPIDLD